jgi:hypothetical protein
MLRRPAPSSPSGSRQWKPSCRTAPRSHHRWQAGFYRHSRCCSGSSRPPGPRSQTAARPAQMNAGIPRNGCAVKRTKRGLQLDRTRFEVAPIGNAIVAALKHGRITVLDTVVCRRRKHVRVKGSSEGCARSLGGRNRPNQMLNMGEVWNSPTASSTSMVLEEPL